MAVVEAILAMIKEASPRLYVLDALVTFDGVVMIRHPSN